MTVDRARAGRVLVLIAVVFLVVGVILHIVADSPVARILATGPSFGIALVLLSLARPSGTLSTLRLLTVQPLFLAGFMGGLMLVAADGGTSSRLAGVAVLVAAVVIEVGTVLLFRSGRRSKGAVPTPGSDPG